MAETLNYEQAKEMARNHDPAARVRLAGRTDLPPEILFFLANDPAPEVRRAVAENQALPHQADLLLARDSDQSVREGLASKIAKLAPGLSTDDQDRLRRQTYEALETLARDQMTRVRQILSEALKDVADAPTDVIRMLARDAEIVVSGPVLEYSPVLSDADLLEIIESGPAAGGLGAIARRANVSEGVSDAVAATDDVEAIADLLGNTSAQIREETLDALIERAPSVDLWHAPLVGRPHLPQGTAARLALFVADNLIGVLEKRTDLDGATLEAVRSVVQRRLADARGDAISRGPDPTSSQDFLKIAPPITVAKRLHGAGRLDNNVVAKAMHASDHAFVLAALIVRSDLPTKVVEKVFAERSAKGILAICHRAELPAKLSVPIQQRMGRIPPADVLQPRGTAYPLGEDEMAWQLEFFADLVGKEK
ncbi:MAG: DUF2336 domain-containing protein [Magnetospirillum sp. WYHS-4]